MSCKNCNEEVKPSHIFCRKCVREILGLPEYVKDTYVGKVTGKTKEGNIIVNFKYKSTEEL